MESTSNNNVSPLKNIHHNFSSYSATNVNSSDTMPRDVEAPTKYVPNVAKTTPQVNVKAKPTNAQSVKKNTRPGMKTVLTKLVYAKTSSIVNAEPQSIIMNRQNSHRTTQTIAILQYNLHKSQATTYSVLNDPISSKYAILLLQEQYFSTYANSSPTHHSWELIESKAMANHPPRAAIYLNNTILPAHSYETVFTEIPDTVAIALQLDQE
jgi:hypothetical protein